MDSAEQIKRLKSLYSPEPESWRVRWERERNGKRIAECLALLHEQDDAVERP